MRQNQEHIIYLEDNSPHHHNRSYIVNQEAKQTTNKHHFQDSEETLCTLSDHIVVAVINIAKMGNCQKDRKTWALRPKYYTWAMKPKYSLMFL